MMKFASVSHSGDKGQVAGPLVGGERVPKKKGRKEREMERKDKEKNGERDRE
jgi:hypothetical protein